MFPRRYFPGRYFAPRYWPESEGEAPVVEDIGQRFCGNAVISKRATAAAAVTKRVEADAVIDGCAREE